MADFDPDLFADGSSVIVCYGGAKPGDTHLASRIVAIDGEIIDWLARREQRGHNRSQITRLKDDLPKAFH